MSFLTLADFTGEVNVSQNKYANTDLTYIIASVEESILKDLLGEDLYNKFITDLASITPSAIYTDLRDGKTYTVQNSDGVTVNVLYKGIKPMLKYFTHAELIKFQDSQNTETGQVTPENNNSVRMVKAHFSALIEASYNKGVALYSYDIENYSDYITNPIYGNEPITAPFQNYNEVKKYDYYKELIKGSCFNFLYKYKANYPTWQFTSKDKMFIGGYL